MSGKFISPFISDETGGEGADEGDLTIPDALLFNDSLDEGVDPTALLEDADLPADGAAAEPNSTSASAQKGLNDSLNVEDLDETQLPGGDDLTQATVGETAATTSAEPKAVAPESCDSSSKEHCDKLSPKVNPSSTDKKAESNFEAKTSPTTESQASKGAKVKPSFGKKKKGFAPPKITKKAATTKGQSENSKQSESSNASNKSSPQSSSPEIAADSTKQQPLSDTDNHSKTTSEKVSSTEKKKVKLPDKETTKEQKKREKEQKEHERAQKKQALEQKKLEKEKKKAELERQHNEKRLELERKKAEREQKKMEKELKKMEREQKKAGKQAKVGQKKQPAKNKETNDSSSSEVSVKKDQVETSSEKVREDKSLSAELKSKVKIASEEAIANEADNPVKSGDEAIGGNVEEKEPIPSNEKQADKGRENVEEAPKDAAAVLSPIASCNAETKKQVKKFSPPKIGGDQQTTIEADVKEKENIPPNEAQSSDVGEHKKLAEDVTAASSPIVNKYTETSGDESKKQKEKKAKKFLPPKAKKDASSASKVKKQRKAVNKTSRAEKSSGDGESKKTPASKGKKRKVSVYSDSDDELESKKSKPTDHHCSVWVQCENASCKKWRRLEDCDDPAKVPGKWICSMNTDPDHNSCSAEEEQWSDLGDSQEFVESPYIPGSLVWSKMDGYPWWPAMVEEDPNEEAYYEMGYRDDPIPVKYHVVFFDTPVSRGWTSSLHTLPYNGHKDPNKDGNVSVPQKHKRSLTEGKKQANKALSLTVKERLETFGFAKRFHGGRTERRKRRAEDSPEAIPSQSKYRKTTSAGERKSARLKVSSDENAIPLVSLKPLQHQQPADNEEVVNTESSDNSLMHQHEE